MCTPNDARLLFLPDEDNKTYLHDKWVPATCGLFAFMSVCSYNIFSGRPLHAGIPRHIGWTALAIYLGTFLSERRLRYLSDRDAMFRHYIELHPEDFPPPDRKKLKDIFKPWHPVR